MNSVQTNDTTKHVKSAVYAINNIKQMHDCLLSIGSSLMFYFHFSANLLTLPVFVVSVANGKVYPV